MMRLIPLLTLCLAAASAWAQTAVEVRVENPLDQPRPDEVVELDWAELTAHLPALADGHARVTDAATGEEVPAQAYDADGDGQPDALLVLVRLWPNETRAYTVEAAPSALEVAPRVYARHDAARDDVAWENDRIAFRTYGQGLWDLEDLVSSGIDVLTKRTRDLVLDRWYASGDYHTDHGEGADFFAVGPTLGGGGTAVWRDGQLHRAENFAAHRILANGPIRTVVELTYAPWDADGVEVSEVKRITMDAGQHVFRSESTFETAGADSITYAVGLVKRDGLAGSTKQATPGWAWLSAWGPVARGSGGHGDLGTVALLDRSRLVDVRETDDHYLALLTATPGEPVVQYVGAGWTASGDFGGIRDWWAYLDALARRLEHPVRVTLMPTAP